MDKNDQDTNSRYSRRGFLKGLGASLLVAAGGTACKEEEAATNDGPLGPDGETKGGTDGQGAAAPKTSGVLKKLKNNNKLRLSLTELAHFADRSKGGLLAIQLGTIAARKYTNGGWRAGWDTTPRTSGKEKYFEADSKSARVFFKHERGGFDTIIVRMKAVKSSNKVTFYVNDEAISSTDIDGSWKDYTVKIPKKVTKTGENQLMMRFRHETTVSGRKQVAHVSTVHVVPSGAKVSDAPRGDVLQKVSFGDIPYDALVAATPQTYTFRVEIPKDKPQLGLAWGARQAGAKFLVTAKSDTTSKKTLLDETVGAEKAGNWGDKALDLSDFADQVAELELTVSGDWKDGQFAAWGEPSLYSGAFKDSAKAPKDPSKPAKHLVFYLIDTLRYDKFKFYNSKTRVKTPNINAFAADATIFDHAYDNENWTKPSTATILTGLYPETHNAKEDNSKLPLKAKMVSQHLKSNGFKTGSFLANGYVSDAFGFKKGWDHYTNYIREKRNTNADNVVKEALDWMKTNKDGKRMFAYLHTIDPHVPYSPPKEFKKMYYKQAYDGPIKPQATGDQLAEIKTDKLKITKNDKRYLEALYDGEVTFNDREFGKLIDGLKEMGIYEDTVVIVVADHGEEFWDHGKVGHGHSLYEEMIHSPLIVRYPNKIATGRRVPHVVSMVDVVPSLCDLLGVEKHDDFEGVSFVDAFDGVGEPRPRIAVADFLYRKKAVRVGRYKWITMGRGGDLYDVVADKREKKDLIASHHIGRAFVRTHFGLFKGASEPSRWWIGKQREGAKKTFEADSAELDPELEQQLIEMGYVDGAKGGPSAKEDKRRMEEEDEN